MPGRFYLALTNHALNQFFKFLSTLISKIISFYQTLRALKSKIIGGNLKKHLWCQLICLLSWLESLTLLNYLQNEVLK